MLSYVEFKLENEGGEREHPHKQAIRQRHDRHYAGRDVHPA